MRVAGGLLAVTALSVLLRTSRLDLGFWIDEAIAVGIASHDLREIPALLRQDGSPPLYYLLLHGWMALAGDGESATRALSLAIAALAVPVAWWAGSAVGGRRAGAIAAGIAALCPFLTYYAQEARMYTLVAVLSLVATAAFARRRRALLVVALTLLLYTHTWGVFLVAGMAVAWVACRRPARDGALMGAAVALLYLPWLPSLAYQTLHTGAPWSARPSILTWPPRSCRRSWPCGAARPRSRACSPPWCRSAWPWRGSCRRSSPPGRPGTSPSSTDPCWWRWPACSRAGRAGWRRRPPRWRRPGCWPVRPPAKSNARAVAVSVGITLRAGDLVVCTQPEQIPVLHRYLPPGVRYLTPLGTPADPSFTDWRDAVPRARAATARRVLLPRLRALAPGRRVVLVTPVGRRPRAPWGRAVRIRTGEWRAALRAEPRLRSLGGTSRPDPARYRSTVRAEIFEVVR